MRTGFMPPSRRTRWRDSKMSVAVRARAKQRIYPRLLAAGEPKAHSEIAKRHSVRFRCLAGTCRPARLPKPACDPHHAFAIRRHIVFVPVASFLNFQVCSLVSSWPYSYTHFTRCSLSLTTDARPLHRTCNIHRGTLNRLTDRRAAPRLESASRSHPG